MPVLPVKFKAVSPASTIPAAVTVPSTSAATAAVGTCSMMSGSFSMIDWILIGFVIGLSIFTVVYIYMSRRQVSRIEKYAERSEKTTVKYFKMPSCSYCKRFDDVWDVVSRTMSSNDGTNSIIFDGPIDITTANTASSTPANNADISLARARCNGYPCYMTLRGDSIISTDSGYRDQTAFESWVAQNQ